MRAEFDQNGLDQGYARITFFREASDELAYAEGDSLAVGRFTGSGMEYLCTAGGRWGGKPEGLLLGVKPVINGDSVEFELQPAYVDSMEDGPYEVCLLNSGGEVKARAQVSAYGIAWSGLKGTCALKNYLEPENPAPAKPEAAEKSVPEAFTGGDEKEPAPLPEENAENSADPWEPAPPLAPQEAEPAPARKRMPIIAAAVLIALLLVGGAFFLMRGSNPEPAATQEQAATEQNAEAEKQAAEEAARAEAEKKAAEQAARAEAEKKAAEEAARAEVEKQAAEAAEQAARGDARGRVAKFFAGERTPEAAMKLAAELDSSTAEQQDALFRLYYYAAEAGNAEAAQRYAECVDPSLPAWGTLQKDGAEAWYYYGKSPEGESARARLKEWTEQAAAKGDAAAAAWLKEMK